MEPLPQTQPQTPGLPAALPTARYTRHRPEATLLYELIGQHYPPFLAALEQDGRTLPTFVQQEFAAYLKCGRLEHGFLRVRCAQCHAERLVAFSCKRRGFCPSCGARRMVETAALLRRQRGDLPALGSARRAAGQPGGRGGRDPGLADSA